MPRYAVIDLGSNTIRLVVYDVDKLRKHEVNPGFKRLVNDKAMAGLAAFINKKGAFSPMGVDRAASVLKDHVRHARYFDCKRIDIFATAVVRNATNCRDVVAELEERVGVPVNVLSGEDEAHLDFVGATCDRVIDRGTLIDIGGGSTELVSIRGGRDRERASVPQGSLSSFSDFVAGILPTADELKAIRKAFAKNLAATCDASAFSASTLYGVGGSVRASAKMRAVMDGTDEKPCTVTKGDIADILAACTADPNSYGHGALKACAERVHTLTPGCAVIGSLMKTLGADKLDICKYGVREGYLIERVLGE
ncbi:Ppx/GppA phosphatase family protein [Xiamenia xianingshaonis]|uniref:Exopolyphosphatase n=1 Tax=Xiamenia xianingshaonis TaxID=2682776 RepID=A0A9E6SUP4_9ACTN|nr:exopolyphosphatase [Xiamenia xianingshaonis]NGM17613.1 exopolyphosphatase [Eggerthellaceae bacterium zg-893]NHM13277.1 exopolyphosphatase [Xiamenia xianingshaonis]NHM15350.1 exopolyphosphatase [Xiamenia xianingshaonis]QTU84639.1 exopolyphosphatase [Xiamenia xianingshaonis]